ncbi:MAG: SDR family NAD(P)-dependent oxidoreductase [Actinomycetales bacterium]|nr:SDR family NAD(P)-dependent oxidoreductase [Actinomycetales bacterium]
MAARITSSFGRDSSAREVTAGHDLTGVTAVVTGGASGIGVETVRALAEAGADVVIAGRSREQARSVIADVDRTAPGRTSFEMLDLSDLASVRGFAARRAGQPVHVLINNAGVMACPQSQTKDGLEMQIGTNHFGHFLLSRLLAPALEAGAQSSGRPSRVVALSSIGHVRSDIRWEDIHFQGGDYDKWTAYGQSKTANALFAVGFTQQHRERGVLANAVMPGGILTPLQRHLPIEEQRAMGWLDENDQAVAGFKNTEQGASTSVWAAVGDELEGIGGLYLEDCAEAVPWSPENPRVGVRSYALDPASAERLWALSVDTVAA